MSRQIRAELLKHRSTRTNLGLLGGMIGLVLLAVSLHGFGLPAKDIASSSEQLSLVVGWGEKLAVLFAGLLGAMSVTSEFRHGTIRPTFLVTPRRSRVIASKAVASLVPAAIFGVIAIGLALGLGSFALSARGIPNQMSAGDYTSFAAGAMVAALLWSAIGVGVGAVVRSQVPAVVGIVAWLLFVEGLLVGNLSAAADVARYLPGWAAAGLSDLNPKELDVIAPLAGLAVLILYAVGSAAIGALVTSRRDVA